MEWPETWWSLLAPGLIAVYGLLIGWLLIGWLRLKTFVRSGSKPAVRISVVVAARNEEHNIGVLIAALKAQSYPTALFEVLLVDDASTDNTVAAAKTALAQTANMRVLQLSDDPTTTAHKKRAIRHGIEAATGTLIVTTDADCQMGSDWLASIADCYEQTGAKLIIAPVTFSGEQSFFERLQTLEFMSLQGVTAGAASHQSPLMCNGANLAYEKAAYELLEEPGGPTGIASGDDVFLMLAMKKRFPGQISYLKSRDAIVETLAQPTLGAFLNQRKRWASKSRGYRDPALILTSSIVLLANASLLVTGIAAILYPDWLSVFLTGFLAKCIIDFSFLLLVASFYDRKRLLLLVLPEQFLYIIYVAVMGVVSPFGNYRWKGRRTG